MKNLYLTIFLLIMCLKSYSQSVAFNYTGKHFTVDTSLKHQAFLKEYGVANLRWDYEKSEFDKNNKPFLTNNKTRTLYDSLANKIFLCEQVITYPRNFLKLSHATLGTFYAELEFVNGKYSPSDLICIEEKMREDSLKKDPCPLVEYKYDDFTGERNYSTPYSKDNKSLNIRFYKNVKNNGTAVYFMALNTIITRAWATERGVILLLKNGKKIEKPSAEVTTRVDSHANFETSSIITLSAQDIALLKTSPIKKFKLYVAESEADEPEMMQKLLICLLSKNK